MKDCTTCKYGYEDERLGIPMCHHPKRFSEDCVDFNMHEEKEIKESEKPMNQDEALNDEIKKFIEEYGYERGNDKLLIAIVARHFTDWQKEQDEISKVNYEGARAVYDNTVQHLQEKIDEKYELGKKDMKEQMLKEAVEGVVCYGSKGAYIETDFLGEYNTDVYGNPGDKVRIIVCKKED